MRRTRCTTRYYIRMGDIRHSMALFGFAGEKRVRFILGGFFFGIREDRRALITVVRDCYAIQKLLFCEKKSIDISLTHSYKKSAIKLPESRGQRRRYLRM